MKRWVLENRQDKSFIYQVFNWISKSSKYIWWKIRENPTVKIF